MSGAAAAVAAAAAQARRRVISHFMSQNAVSPELAVPFTAGKRIEQKFFERLRDEGVIVPGVRGGYYLDIPKYDAWKRQRNVAARWVVLAGVVALAIGLAVAIALGGK